MIINRFTSLASKIQLAVIVAGLLVWSGGPTRAQSVIGVLTALSGKPAFLGQQLELGARLATASLADKSPDLELVVADSGCDTDKARVAAKKLLSQGASIVIGPICSKAMIAALAVLSPAGVPIISPSIRASWLQNGRKSNNWAAYSLAADARAEVQNASKILLKRWQGMAYAIADDGGIYGRGVAEEFRILAELSGQKPVAVANFRPLQSNQISLLRRLAKNGIEALFVGGDANDVAQIARDAKKLGLDIEIAGGEPLILLPHVDDAASIPGGILVVMPVEPARSVSALRLVNNLRQEGIEPDGALLSGYALAQIAATALLRNNFELVGQNFETIIGPVSFAKNGHAGAFPYRLHIFSNGQIKPLGGF